MQLRAIYLLAGSEDGYRQLAILQKPGLQGWLLSLAEAMLTAHPM